MLEYSDFYDIAEYGNEAWNGCFSAREVANNAYVYYADFKWSKENDYKQSSIKTLIDNLCEDIRNLNEDEEDYHSISFWLYEMAKELGLIDMDFQDYMETDADIVSRFLAEPVKRNWRNVELKGNNVGRFAEYCRDMHLKYETSETGEYIHFEVLVSEEELEKANKFLSSLD